MRFPALAGMIAATLDRCPGSDAIRRVQLRRLAKQWEEEGRPGAAPHLIKQAAIRGITSYSGARVLVETGTFLGDMVQALRNDFDQIYSIELSPHLHRRAVARFRGAPNVHLIQGDGGEVLRSLVPTLGEPAVFWLDGHYSGGFTARGEQDTPVLAEIDAISKSPVLGHSLLIDDARCFRGGGGYPTLDELRLILERKFPRHAINIANDMVFCTPAELVENFYAGP